MKSCTKSKKTRRRGGRGKGLLTKCTRAKELCRKLCSCFKIMDLHSPKPAVNYQLGIDSPKAVNHHVKPFKFTSTFSHARF